MSKRLLREAALVGTVAIVAMGLTVPTLAEGTPGRSSTAPAARSTSPAALGGESVQALLGKPVYNSNGQVIGRIDDFVVDRQANVSRLTHAVIGVGGFLGLGDRDVAVPIDHLRIFGDEIRISSNVEDRLGQMPEYNRKR